MKKLIFICFMSAMAFAGIGKFVIVKGEVEVVRDGKIIKAISGMDLENQDKINTIGVSKAQIQFEDNTIVSLGKNTSFEINDYVFAQNNSKVDMGVKEGSFKVISGDVGKLARNNFKFQANTATIGIRGTIFAGNVSKKENIIACVQGGITVATGNVMKEVAAGKMVEVKGSSVSAPKPIDTSKIETIQSVDSQQINEELKTANSSDGKKSKSEIKEAKQKVKKAKQELVAAKMAFVEQKKEDNKDNKGGKNKNKDKNKDKDKNKGDNATSKADKIAAKAQKAQEKAQRQANKNLEKQLQKQEELADKFQQNYGDKLNSEFEYTGKLKAKFANETTINNVKQQEHINNDVKAKASYRQQNASFTIKSGGNNKIFKNDVVYTDIPLIKAEEEKLTYGSQNNKEKIELQRKVDDGAIKLQFKHENNTTEHVLYHDPNDAAGQPVTPENINFEAKGTEQKVN